MHKILSKAELTPSEAGLLFRLFDHFEGKKRFE